MDWLGAFLVTAGLTFIIFILAQGEIAEPRQWGTGCEWFSVFSLRFCFLFESDGW